MATSQRQPVLVCGFGITGLTTSIRLLQAGYKVVAVASHLPGDPLSPTYASSAAGAHHLSFAADDDKRQQALDRRTFDVMWEEEEREGDASGLMQLTQVEFYGGEGEKHIAFFETLPGFRVLTAAERPTFAKHAVSFTTLTMDTSAYLNKLVVLFNSLGGIIHRVDLKSLSSALKYVPRPLAIINCTGLGSLTLGDVQDENMYPIRGQVVVLKAPWIKEGRTLQVGNLERTYIIPRRSGEVIIGGTREVNDWHPHPRAETSADIKRRALAICPELLPSSTNEQDLESIVVREVVGFRPARKGGLRLEIGQDLVVGENGETRIPVLHNIGHSGAGWQCSWGCAEEITLLLSKIRGVE